MRAHNTSALFLLLMLFLPLPGLSQEPGSGVVILHESLGEVIDASENAQYRLFGEVPGFSAARVYREKRGGYRIHVLRNFSGGAQLVILDYFESEFGKIKSRVIDCIEKRDESPEAPIISLHDKIRDHPSDEILRFALHDGTQLHGMSIRAASDTLIVRTSGGLEIAVPDAQIARVDLLQGQIHEGEFRRSDPNGTRLLLSSTGRGLKRGQGYFADYYLFFPTLAVGVTNNLSVSGGVSIVPTAPSQLAYLGPKLAFEITPNVNLATGALHVMIPEESDDVTLGYAVGTFGSLRSAITLGAAIPLNKTLDDSPVLLIGGELQISNNAKLLTENWIFTHDNGMLIYSGGVRFFGERLAVDLAMIGTSEGFGDEGFPFVPWMDFSVFFGR